MVALEDTQTMDNIGYIYNTQSKEVDFLVGLAYGEIECVETLKYTRSDLAIECLKNVLKEITRRNA